MDRPTIEPAACAVKRGRAHRSVPGFPRESESRAKSLAALADRPRMNGPNQSGAAPQRGPLRSEYADDPDMREIVEFFVNDLNARINSIREAFDRDDRARLKTLAHQLKGAAGGYGFPSIGQAAGAVERELLGHQADIANLGERVEDLINLCRSAVPSPEQMPRTTG